MPSPEASSHPERQPVLHQRGEPTGTPPVETRQQLSPRGELERHFEGYFAGSARVKAMADKVELVSTKAFIDQSRDIFREPLGDEGFVRLLMKEAQIEETIRKRSSGKHAAEYNASQIKYKIHLENYKEEAKNQYGDVFTDNQLTQAAAKSLLIDLKDINENLPIKE
jgi:hypothetical protein